MSTSFGGLPCVDPRLFRVECLARGLPTDWWGRPNGFDLQPVGRGPGRGWVLLRKADLDGLDLTTDHELVFTGETRDSRITLADITLRRATCLSPGAEDDPQATYLCEVTDRRQNLSKIPLDTAYNVTDTTGAAYLASTKNGGSAWTWQQVVTDLTTALGLSTLTLPFAPHGTPENLSYWGAWAWDALNDVLDRIGCGVLYDPEADSFSVVRLGVTDAAAEDAMAGSRRTWDHYPVDPSRAWRPEKVRVRFRRMPRPTAGSTPYYNKDITLAAATGVASGTYVQLDDDLTAVGATGAPTNQATLDARAQERADDWLRKRAYYERPLLKVYRDFVPGVVRDAPGATVGNVCLDDRGGLMRTEVAGRPDGLLERWRSLAHLPPWFPADAGSGLTVEEADGSPSYVLTLPATLRFNQANGFAVTNPSAGVAQVGLTPTLAASEVSTSVRTSLTADNTWTDLTGLTALAIPAAGTYWVYAVVNASGQSSALSIYDANYIDVRVVNSGGTVLYASVPALGVQAIDQFAVDGKGFGCVLTFAGAATLKLQAMRVVSGVDFFPTWTAAYAGGGSGVNAGKAVFGYIRIA